MSPSPFCTPPAWSFVALALTCTAVGGCYDPVDVVGANPPVPGGGKPANPGPPGGPGSIEENNHHQSKFIVEADEGILLRGTISCEESVTGNIQLDFLQLDETGRRELVHGMQVQELGQWSERVPENFGEIYIMAFADNDRNGPSDADPKASVGPIQIGTSAMDSIDLVLVKDADMGALALSASGDPPSGSPPPDASPASAQSPEAAEPLDPTP